MPLAEAAGAICVQRFDGSRNSAIHTTYRISLRSSSIREPRYPLLRVVFGLWLGAAKSRLPVGFRGVVCLGCVEVGQNYQAGRRGWPPSVKKEGPLHPPRQTWAPRLSAGARGLAPLGVEARGVCEVTGVDSIDSMILPQVHLRKPCYDFSFL